MSKQQVKEVKTLEQLRAELAEVSRAHRLGELQNTALKKQLRHEIARALSRNTAQNEDNNVAESDKKEEEK